MPFQPAWLNWFVQLSYLLRSSGGISAPICRDPLHCIRPLSLVASACRLFPPRSGLAVPLAIMLGPLEGLTFADLIVTRTHIEAGHGDPGWEH